jgi:hypothetical protein
MVRQIVLASFVVFLPVGTQAQGRGMMPPVSHAMAVAPRVVVQAPHAGTMQGMPAARVVVRGGAVRPKTGMPVARGTQRVVTTRRRFEVQDINLRPDCNSAPGFGFDAVHQAAVCGSNVVGSRRPGLQVPLFFPFFDGGFFLPGSSVGVEENSTTEVSQQEAAEAERRERSRRNWTALQPAAPAAAPTPAVEASKAAPPDNDEFVFVRRDGTVFFAVAYTWENGTLRYITGQGLGHTVAQDALDLVATRQFNEQRGLIFRSPV